ncbi:MAG: stage II sporulation protein M [Anaerolineae bacterium]|nr:stage II sporulation protein M [Anaerolineae bacterium]
MSVDAIRRPVQSRARVVWAIARRELRDTLRDWRIIFPIVGLTLLFPWLMNWTAQTAVEFVQRQNADIIGERLIPFLLMVVGFFPMSFSLVIALETFVGEKERRSIEPLLSMPISDLELYLGKMIAATALPLLGSILGISVYLAGLQMSIGYIPPPDLIAQIFALNVITALVMVSGAVVISSQTTSVRAANLLASFIIIPTAILIQAESIVMFWGNYRALWIIALGLLVVMALLVRMGVNTFNREEILGREIDELNLRRTLRLVRHYFVQPPGGIPAPARGTGRPPALRRLAGWIARVYRTDLPYLLRQNWMPVAIVALSLVGAWAIGWAYVDKLPLPEGALVLGDLSEEDFQMVSDLSFLPSLTTGGIFWHNARVLILAGVLALISLGVLPVLLLMVPLVMVAFLAGQFAVQGYSALTFVGAFIVPHGLVEIPAAMVATAFALRVGASVTAVREGTTVSESVVAAVADLVKVFVFLVVPLLLIAAFVEANITPQVVLWAYGG